MTADKLIPVRMKKEDMSLPEVQAFRCGSKPHETQVAEWLKNYAVDEINRKGKIWLYRLRTDEGPLVGYSCLATWKINTTEEDNSTKVIKVYETPSLALHEDFWRGPHGITDPEEKYSRQIVRHLQERARTAQLGSQCERLLTLFVHPDAEPAQKLYLACGFKFVDRYLPCPEAPPLGLWGMDYSW